MPADKQDKFWLLVTAFLDLVIIAGSLVIWFRHDSGQPLVISEPPPAYHQSNIIIDGAVANPGTYPLKAEDTIDTLLMASGGTTQDADLSRIQLFIPSATTPASSQKVDINSADLWLLEALPGIGEVKAQAIIDFRKQNGPFGTIQDLLKVPGITGSIFEKVKTFITAGQP